MSIQWSTQICNKLGYDEILEKIFNLLVPVLDSMLLVYGHSGGCGLKCTIERQNFNLDIFVIGSMCPENRRVFSVGTQVINEYWNKEAEIKKFLTFSDNVTYDFHSFSEIKWSLTFLIIEEKFLCVYRSELKPEHSKALRPITRVAVNIFATILSTI